jgi:hypothetical protein
VPRGAYETKPDLEEYESAPVLIKKEEEADIDAASVQEVA